MEQYQHIVNVIAMAMGVAWASGINLYATLLTLGVLGITGHMTLPPDLQILSDPLVIAAAALMFMVEFVADKMPGVDTGWDGIHTFIRIPAGALLAAGAIGQVDPALSLAAAIVGGAIAAGSHVTKAGTRVLVNASPEPFSNWVLSIGEDLLVVGGLWTALQHPWLFLGMLALFVLLMIWLLPKLWRGIKKVFGYLSGWIKGRKEVPPQKPPPVNITPARPTGIPSLPLER